MNNAIAEACRAYASLLCHRRELEKAERILLEMAPEDALEYLDTIKRIMEIDQKVTDPNEVLMRASVLMEKRHD